jgi:N utilization substance protein B
VIFSARKKSDLKIKIGRFAPKKVFEMINRRNIRSKVMQQFYSMEHAEGSLEEGLKTLQENLQNIYKLYLLLLSLLVKIRAYEEELLRRRKNKFFKTREDLNPNMKFVNNLVLKKWAENENLKHLLEKFKLDKLWDEEIETVRYFLEKIKNSKLYKSYMQRPGNDFEEDKAFLMDVYKNIIAPDNKLRKFLEDWEINWADDVAIANTLVMKTLDATAPGDTPRKDVPSLYKNEEDERFGHELLLRAWQNRETLYDLIKSKTVNWDFERISEVDKILMALALAEFLYFPSIPETATINEYVEIAKEFSTPKSNAFINGILDRLYKELREGGKINKTYEPKNS